jgi:16S rRNA (cytosine1402-N4)-methyltransferase
MAYHIPALLDESIEGLDIRAEGIYVDVTFGGGGHSREILKRMEGGKLIAFDQDEDARRNLPGDKRVIFLEQNFRFLKNNLIFNGITEIDGLIADLGVSFHQFDEPERGFTFRTNAPLDMRMNRKGTVTAGSLLNSLEEKELADIFYNYGDLSDSRRIAAAIVSARKVNPFSLNGDLLSVIEGMAPPRQENKFFARVFQALRIAVNKETESLEEMLLQALEMLRNGGRLVVITYHSLEDRLVKNFMKSGSFAGELEKDFYGNVITPFRLVTRKAVVVDDDEVASNPRARSARLRIAEKI